MAAAGAAELRAAGDARRSRSTWRPPSSTRNSSPRQTMPHWRVHGPGWAPSPWAAYPGNYSG